MDLFERLKLSDLLKNIIDNLKLYCIGRCGTRRVQKFESISGTVLGGNEAIG